MTLLLNYFLLVKALKQLKRCLDALERNYLTAREEHCHLRQRNYKDKSISVGEFDPERLEDECQVVHQCTLHILCVLQPLFQVLLNTSVFRTVLK